MAPAVKICAPSTLLYPFTTQKRRLHHKVVVSFRHPHHVIHSLTHLSNINFWASDSSSLSLHLFYTIYCPTSSRISSRLKPRARANMSQSSSNPGNGQLQPQNVQASSQTPNQTSAPNPAQGDPHAQDEYLNAQAAVMLNEFLTKSRQLVATEVSNDMLCTICSEPFLRGDNPEIPVRLHCSHIFGMNCILKWLSPVSRNGKNSCPNCRKPIFDDWDKMDFPAPRRLTRPSTTTSGITPAPNSRNSNPAFAQPPTPSTPAVSLSAVHARMPAATVIFTQADTVSTTTSSMTAAIEAVAPNTASSSAAQDEREPAQRLGEARRRLREAETRLREAETQYDEARTRNIRFAGSLEHLVRQESRRRIEAHIAVDHAISAIRSEMNQRIPNLARGRQIQREVDGRSEAIPMTQRATQRPPVTPTSTRAEANPPSEDEYIGVASMFTAAEAEHDREQQRRQAVGDQRKRHMWMQFCEGIVRTIEQSTDSTALANHEAALTVINMADLDEFMTERAAESPTWQRILRTFPRLHTEMVTRFDDFRPIPCVNIDNRIALERLLSQTRFDMQTLHRSRWYTRLSERIARGAATSEHEAAVARLTERMASLSSPSAASSNSTSTSGPLTQAEETEVRRIEDYLLGRTTTTTTTVRRKAAPRAGAANNRAIERARDV